MRNKFYCIISYLSKIKLITLLYLIIKTFAKIAFKFYCRDIIINNKDLLKNDGPIMLAANHPNSFLDAIILCTLFNKPVYSLARGDAFKNRFLAKLLYKLKMLPVYRETEGVENLEKNYQTFDKCKEIFKQNGIVLIFSEGRCINEWHLRPLKKGTARLAISCWKDEIPLKVLPVAINYSSFKKFGKNIQLFFGDFIYKNDIALEKGHGKSIQNFNNKLLNQLQPFVFEIDNKDYEALKNRFWVKQTPLKNILLFLPYIFGWAIHLPLYLPVKIFTKKVTYNNDHFDSVIVSILLFAYPIYILIIMAIALFVFNSFLIIFVIGLLMPCLAWSYIQLKCQIDS